MPARRQASLRTDFIINDQVNGYPTRSVVTTASRAELDEMVSRGFLVCRELLDAPSANALAEAVLRLAKAEESLPESECLAGQSIYIRALLDKDAAFHFLLRLASRTRLLLLSAPDSLSYLPGPDYGAGRGAMPAAWITHESRGKDSAGRSE